MEHQLYSSENNPTVENMKALVEHFIRSVKLSDDGYLHSYY